MVYNMTEFPSNVHLFVILKTTLHIAKRSDAVGISKHNHGWREWKKKSFYGFLQ